MLKFDGIADANVDFDAKCERTLTFFRFSGCIVHQNISQECMDFPSEGGASFGLYVFPRLFTLVL